MAQRKSDIPRNIVAAVIGGCVFMLFLFVFRVHFLPAAGLAVAGYIGGMLILAPKKKEDDLLIGVSGVTREMYDQIMEESLAKLDTIRSLTRDITDQKIKQKALRVCDVIERIMEDLKQDPKDVKPARRFLAYYMDATINILKKYSLLARYGSQDSASAGVMAKVDSMLDSLANAFERQLAKLFEDDVLDLDTELTVLDRTIRMEGLGPGSPPDTEETR